MLVVIQIISKLLNWSLLLVALNLYSSLNILSCTPVVDYFAYFYCYVETGWYKHDIAHLNFLISIYIICINLLITRSLVFKEIVS